MNESPSITSKNNSTQVNKDICDAFECNSKPSNKIDIDCGAHGTLTIFVCDKCLNKFS